MLLSVVFKSSNLSPHDPVPDFSSESPFPGLPSRLGRYVGPLRPLSRRDPYFDTLACRRVLPSLPRDSSRLGYGPVCVRSTLVSVSRVTVRVVPGSTVLRRVRLMYDPVI